MSCGSKILQFLLGLFAMPLDDKYIEAKRHRHGPVETYEVFVEDFNRIETEASIIGADLTFASIWLSVGVTSTAALPAVPHDWNIFLDVFLMLTFAGYTFGIFFLLRWRRQKNSLKTLMDRIRACQIPQWGDEGKELRVADLEKLKPVEPEPVAVDVVQVTDSVKMASPFPAEGKEA